MFTFHSSNYSGFSLGTNELLDAIEEAASCSLSPSPSVLVLPIDLGYVGRYVEIRGSRKRAGMKERLFVKEKEEDKKRHLGKDTG